MGVCSVSGLALGAPWHMHAGEQGALLRTLLRLQTDKLLCPSVAAFSSGTIINAPGSGNFLLTSGHCYTGMTAQAFLAHRSLFTLSWKLLSVSHARGCPLCAKVGPQYGLFMLP